MPNHIRNKIELIGSNEEIELFVKRYSETVDGIELFPSFDKIVKMPECFSDLNPHHGIIDAVKNKYGVGYHANPLIRSLEISNRENNNEDFNDEEKKVFEKCCKAYEETGFIYWYDWRLHFWGTKWGAYECERLDENTFVFDTAWSGVPKMIEKMANEFKNIKIIYSYSDEDTGNNVGIYIFKNGKTNSTPIENNSKEAYDLAFEHRPEYREYYKLVNGNYEYIEED